MAGGSPRAGVASAGRQGLRRINLSELGTGLFFVSLIAYFGYDGFKQIFAKPEPFKPKEAQESIAELRAAINKGLGHKHLKNVNPERRSALATEPPPGFGELHSAEPVFQAEDEEELLPYTKVVVVSAMQDAPCLAEGGDKLHYLSVLNKQDYARANGYDFVLGIKQVDPQLENMWNKPAWINKVLDDESLAAEWVVWMDIDTVVLDANFTLPFEEFAAKSKDLVVYGNKSEVETGHPVKALNTGVMAIRNTPWARHFFKEVARLGRLDDHHKGKNTLSKVLLSAKYSCGPSGLVRKILHEILLKELQSQPYSDGLRDQNAVIYLLKTHPEWQDRVQFQDKEICLNCYWQDLIGVTGYGHPTYERKENVSFVQHFMGCQTCNALNRNGDLEKCQDGMFHSFRFTSSYHQPMLRHSRPRSEGDLAQLRQIPFCSNNPTAYGCVGARPLTKELQEQFEREKHRPQYNWKDVDNATVAHAILTLEDGHDLGSTEEPKTVKDGELQSGGLGGYAERLAGQRQRRESHHNSLSLEKGVELPHTDLEPQQGFSAKEAVREKAVGRRRAAEGMRSRVRRSRAASQRASHSLIRNPELQYP